MKLDDMTGPARYDLRTQIGNHIAKSEPNPTVWRDRVRAIAEQLGLNISRIGWADPKLDAALFSLIEEARKQGKTAEQLRAAAGLA